MVMVLELVGEFVKAGRKLSFFPTLSRHHFQQRLTFGVTLLHAERIGEPRRHRANAPRGINLPQPVRFVLFKFAQEQRNNRISLSDAVFSNARFDKASRRYNRRTRSQTKEACDRQRQLPLASPNQTSGCNAAHPYRKGKHC